MGYVLDGDSPSKSKFVNGKQFLIGFIFFFFFEVPLYMIYNLSIANDKTG